MRNILKLKKKKKIVIELAHKKPNINPKCKANPI